MISDVLTETVIEEAEAIVRTEWERLHHDTAPRDQVRCEMPAARTCCGVIATSTAILEAPRLPGLPRRDAPQLRVWPTQRSPPRCRGVSRKALSERR